MHKILNNAYNLIRKAKNHLTIAILRRIIIYVRISRGGAVGSSQGS